MENLRKNGSADGDQRLPEHIEDVHRAGAQSELDDAAPNEPAPAPALSNEQLLEGGLAPTQAWVRTRKSSGARRTQRHREEQAAQGIKQINVIAPEAAHDAIKKIAERTKAGTPLLDVINDLAKELMHDLPAPSVQNSDQVNALGIEAQQPITAETPKGYCPGNPADDLQKCRQRQDELEQQLTNMRIQLAAVQALPKLTGWRRALVCRLVGVKR